MGRGTRHPASAVIGVTLLAACATVVWLRADAAQKAAPETPRSTLNGVYTAAQADKGKEIFANICQGCHTTASQSGTAFANRWKWQPLSDLYTFIDEEMPKDDPGSLKPAEEAEVIAYLLKLNGLPAGKEELPGDVDALKKIKIELPPAGAGGGGRYRAPRHD